MRLGSGIQSDAHQTRIARAPSKRADTPRQKRHRTSLRQQAIDRLYRATPDLTPGPEHEQRLDALLDWFDTNDERLAEVSKCYTGADVQMYAINRLVAVLREDTP